MKKIILAISIVSFLVFLAGCNNKSSENHDNNSSSDTNTSENKENETNKKTNTSGNRDTKDKSNKQNKKQSNNKVQEKENNDSNESHQSTDKNKSYLNNFSSEKIEYARVWYQLISTRNDLKGVRNVYVTKIPKGSKVNPQAQNSAVYKEDVVKLEAPMKAGGSVTYSSNGNGSINVYNSIPYKWENPQNSDYSQMNKITRKAIEDNVETIYIKPHDNKTVAKLANKVKYNK
ncbi:hypothetical protein AST01_12105 [Staphylococcus equorum]|uniref:hypothetical protein n=1 Tax=Staphylococcus equorum TaxID=246432 RepID=UPI000853862B|nr:hypothetical protein [Staphylococcus equorum]OEK65744.1 hypothetical protein AST01_12105 [Staphylococcus equorum]